MPKAGGIKYSRTVVCLKLVGLKAKSICIMKVNLYTGELKVVMI